MEVFALINDDIYIKVGNEWATFSKNRSVLRKPLEAEHETHVMSPIASGAFIQEIKTVADSYLPVARSRKLPTEKTCENILTML